MSAPDLPTGTTTTEDTINKPLSVVVIDWPSDTAVLQALRLSWVQQYSDYLGGARAELLVGRLLESGRLYPDKQTPVLGAYRGEQLVGVASCRALEGLSLITMLEVLEGFRQQGVGSALVCALGDHAEHLVAHVSIHRPEIRAFYQQSGFKQLQRTEVEHDGHWLEFDVLAK